MAIMEGRDRAIEAEAKQARDLALLTAYYAAGLYGADFKKQGIATFDAFRRQFEPKRALSREEVWARLDAMADRGLVTTTIGRA